MKRILVAVDMTKDAPDVVATAVELARSLGAKVRLLHVVGGGPSLPPPPGLLVTPPATQVQIESAQSTLRDLEQNVPEELRDGVFVEIGSAADTICGFARSYGADIVVLGAHQHGIVARVLGTTAAKVVNRIDRPVFVVRPVPDVGGSKTG